MKRRTPTNSIAPVLTAAAILAAGVVAFCWLSNDAPAVEADATPAGMPRAALVETVRASYSAGWRRGVALGEGALLRGNAEALNTPACVERAEPVGDGSALGLVAFRSTTGTGDAPVPAQAKS